MCLNIYLYILAFLLAFTSVAGADDQYPCQSDPAGRWAPGVQDHNYLVRRTIGPHSFDIPYGYLMIRPSANRVNCYSKRSSISFAFWIPDLRPPLSDMWSQPNFRVQEPGRSKPSTDEFVVSVLTASPNNPGAPTTMFRNTIGFLAGSYQIRFENGLLHVIPSENLRAFEGYFDLSNNNNQVALDCTPSGEDSPPNPSCKGTIYFHDLGLTLVVLFPKDGLPYWKAIRDGTSTLLDQWSVAPQ